MSLLPFDHPEAKLARELRAFHIARLPHLAADRLEQIAHALAAAEERAAKAEARADALQAEIDLTLTLPDAADAYVIGKMDGLAEAQNSDVGRVIIERDAALARAAIEQSIRRDTERRMDDLKQVRLERDDLRSRNADLERRLAEAHEALEPIQALVADYVKHRGDLDGNTIIAGRLARKTETGSPPRILWSDLRRAAAVLASSKEPGNVG